MCKKLLFVAVLLPCIFALPSALVAKDDIGTDKQTALLQLEATAQPLVRQPGQAISTPFERFGASSVVSDGKIYSFGGMERGGALPSNDLLVFDTLGKAWSTLPVYGQKPPGRFFHSASVSADQKTMYIMGGTPCFSRIYMKSLEFDDSNGAYVTQRQHATTEALSVEHAQGLDDVFSFNFATREWTQLKAASDPHVLRCKAASNVFYKNSATTSLPLPLTLLTTLLAVYSAL